MTRNVKVKLRRDGAMCVIPVPFDPARVFGKVRAPVKVTIRGHSYRSTIFSMHGQLGIPLRRSHREAAGLEGSETVDVRIALDTSERVVETPADLASALKKNLAAAAGWKASSYTHRREHVEALLGAKKPETRARRLGAMLRALADKAG